jgi:hypothetical protein
MDASTRRSASSGMVSASIAPTCSRGVPGGCRARIRSVARAVTISQANASSSPRVAK